MTMSASPDYRERQIAKALASVRAAENARRLYDSFEGGHSSKTAINDENTRVLLEDTIRTAMGYGYPVEAVAAAAALTVGQVEEIVGGSSAASA